MSFTSANTSALPTGTFAFSKEGSEEILRANLFLALARAFSSPLDMDQAQPQQLRIATKHLAELQRAGDAVADAWEEGLQDRETMSVAYSRLFLGPFEILASPYASMYLDPEQQLMGPVSQMVAQAYVDAGLGPGDGPNEIPDHVALEWEFLYYLTYQHVVTGEPQWLEQRDAFRSEHVDRWMPLLAKRVRDSSDHAFYSALAEFMREVFDYLKKG